MPACSEDQKYMFSKSLNLNPESPACETMWNSWALQDWGKNIGNYLGRLWVTTVAVQRIFLHMFAVPQFELGTENWKQLHN